MDIHDLIILKFFTREENMKKFKLHWLDGKTEIVEGYNIADACRRAGIGNGALRALDYYEPVKEESSAPPIDPTLT